MGPLKYRYLSTHDKLKKLFKALSDKSYLHFLCGCPLKAPILNRNDNLTTEESKAKRFVTNFLIHILHKERIMSILAGYDKILIYKGLTVI